MSNSVLVTGGAGFIGSHLTELLLSLGYRVVVLDSFDPFYDPKIKRQNLHVVANHPNWALIEGDIRDPTAVATAFSKGPYSAVVHLAARAGVRPSLRDPLLYEDVNVGGTVRLLDAVRETPAAHFVLASSSSVYGATSQTPFSESAPADRPSSPYAATKRSAEMMAYAYHHLYGLEITALRLFTVYGPRQRPEMAIHRFTRQIAHGEAVDIYGDGTTRRDYTFVADVVDGIARAIDAPSGYRVYNLGTRETTALAELIDMIGTRVGRSPILRRLPEQPGDVPVTCADISCAEADLGYRARTPIGDGLDRFVDWYRAKNPG